MLDCVKISPLPSLREVGTTSWQSTKLKSPDSAESPIESSLREAESLVAIHFVVRFYGIDGIFADSLESF